MDFRLGKPVPEVERRWTFISTNSQVQLAAEVASYMAATDKYVACFEFPSLDYPYTGSADFGTDGYIARAMGDRVATRINNALARIQPEMIVFLALTEIDKGYFTARLPSEIVIDLESAAQIPSVLGINPKFAGEVVCRPNEVIRGLLRPASKGSGWFSTNSLIHCPRLVLSGTAVFSRSRITEIYMISPRSIWPFPAEWMSRFSHP